MQNETLMDFYFSRSLVNTNVREMLFAVLSARWSEDGSTRRLLSMVIQIHRKLDGKARDRRAIPHLVVARNGRMAVASVGWAASFEALYFCMRRVPLILLISVSGSLNHSMVMK